MPGEVVIWHNPRCSKSRATLALLRDRGVEPKVVEYLRDPPTAAALSNALAKLGVQPRNLMRRQEAPYKELGLKDADDARLVEAMAEQPILIERPVVFVGQRAALGRPPEAVLELFKDN